MKPVLHYHRNRPVRRRPNIEQKVAAPADDVCQHDHELASRVVILKPLGAVVAVAEAHAAAFFPGMVEAAHARRVLRGPVAAVLVARIAAPAVIDHYLVFHQRFVEEPCKQLGAAPRARRQLPLAIAEDDGRLVPRDQVLELREHMVLNVARLVSQP